MNARTPSSGRHGALARLTARVAVVALLLPAARGPLCTVAGHETAHARGLAVSGEAPHGHEAGGHDVTHRSSPVTALDVVRAPSTGCHELMACGATLIAVEWTEAPVSVQGRLSSASERAARILRQGPPARPVPPPPRV